MQHILTYFYGTPFPSAKISDKFWFWSWAVAGILDTLPYIVVLTGWYPTHIFYCASKSVPTMNWKNFLRQIYKYSDK